MIGSSGLKTIMMLIAFVLGFPAVVLPSSVEQATVVVEREVRAQVLAIMDTLVASGGAAFQPILLTVGEHPDDSWLSALVLEQARTKGIEIRTEGDHAKLTIIPRKLGMEYRGTSSADSVTREISVSINATLENNGRLTLISPPPAVVVNTCTRSEAMATQSLQLHATHAELPPEERTVWEDVLEPAIFVAAAITTVVLLFTVRSQ